MRELDSGTGFTNNITSFNLGPQKSHDFEFGHKLKYKNFDIISSFYYMRLRAEISTTDNSFLQSKFSSNKKIWYRE